MICPTIRIILQRSEDCWRSVALYTGFSGDCASAFPSRNKCMQSITYACVPIEVAKRLPKFGASDFLLSIHQGRRAMTRIVCDFLFVPSSFHSFFHSPVLSMCS